MKRIVCLCVALLLTVSLVGCNRGGDKTDGATTTTVATVATTAAPTTPQEVFPRTGYVNATTLRVRPSADTVGEPIGGLVFADAITLLSREGDWFKIRFGGGEGYVSAQYIQDTLPIATEGTSAGTSADTSGTSAATSVAAP